MIDDSGMVSGHQVNVGGSVEGQFAVGEHIHQQHVSGSQQAPTVTEADLAELRNAVDEVRARIRAEAPPEQQAAALERVDEVEQAVVAEEPDLTTLQYVRNWFVKNLPKLAGTVTGLVVHPVVGKIVEAAGDVAASQFRKLFGDVSER
ncbi:hypothetical protein SAMN05660209_02112 [Geodermatophilus africanus]|uniref:Uncharacterized protein n=1 Tax=Geodermatophilus africanus TaxID=1137993 RepID=A0A1H3HJX8_9ACTN|nr:hypothetical protein [Geodermatophilus africanus]SDY14969.1 hypothetical protein SAMN05660209_02112 [Geodermatophilus africanus]